MSLQKSEFYINMRIESLQKDAITNEKLIKKWERKKRKLSEKK